MEGKEILDFLGVEANNLDEFKAQFGTKYYTEKQIHDDKTLLGKFTGKTIAKIKANVLKEAREEEIPFTNNEFDDADIETVVKTIKARKDEIWNGKMEEVKAQVGKSGEEAIKPWQEKLTKYEQALADEKKAKQEIASQFDQFRQEADGKIESIEVNYYRNDLINKINSKLDPVAIKDPLKMEGWNATISKSVKFAKDENGVIQAFNPAGEKFKDPKKADRWLTPDEVLINLADSNNLIPKNPQGGQPAFRQPGLPPQGPGTPPPAQPARIPGKGNRLAPGMEKYLSK